MGSFWTSYMYYIRLRLSLFGKVLVSFIGANGHQIKEEHDFSSKDRWTDKGGKLKSGTFTSRIL
jgi:hypothetical protein